LRALGFPLVHLIALIAFELVGISVLAGMIGVGLGYFIAASLLPDVAATISGLYGQSISGTLQFRPEWWVSSLLIAVGGTALAAAASLWRLACMPLLASARPHAWAMQARRSRLIQAVFAMFLLVAASLLGWLGSGLAAGFAMLAALLIGAALALPVILLRNGSGRIRANNFQACRWR
jgi:putative ABC transport system permease protein